MSDVTQTDQLQQATCEAIVTEIAKAVDAEPSGARMVMRVPGGPEVGWQITVDATEKGGLKSICRLSVLNVDLAPEGEVARVEYEHDKKGKFEARTVYSVQSVRRRGGELVLLENFMAEGPATVREEDFKQILSEAYGRGGVLKSVHDWVQYRAWQLQEQRKK